MMGSSSTVGEDPQGTPATDVTQTVTETETVTENGRSPAPPGAWIPRAPLLDATPLPRERQVLRFSPHQRAQHFLMMSSVLLLVFTGMPQKFFDWPGAQWMIAFWGGLENARFIHRFAGVVMLIAAVYQVVYLVYTILVLRRPLPIWMLPEIKDFKDFFQNTGYYLGLAREKAKFGRYSYLEKFDYWAVFWGVPIMGVTGLILMFPLVVTQYLPGVAVPVATIAHSDEAVLASGWLFIVHFYNAHFAPHIFPFNKSIFTGRVPEHLYKLEHPLEYEQILARHGVEAAGSAGLLQESPPEETSPHDGAAK